METYRTPKLLLSFLTFLVAVSCESQQRYASPPGYDLTKPKRFRMPLVLREISGIAFNKGTADTIYAEQDEQGKVFHFRLGDDNLQTTRFAKKGDFEDISICNNYVIMLRSDGVLFTFPLAETTISEAVHVKTFDSLLPPGEYEGLASIESTGKLYVLCKHCRTNKTSKWGGGSVLQIDTAGNLTASGDFEIDIRQLEKLQAIRKIDFHPSALTFNGHTREWFILSSVNKVLVVADENWQIKNAYSLNPFVFPQPEGIAFDNQQNLYISSEADKTSYSSVQRFDYRKP